MNFDKTKSPAASAGLSRRLAKVIPAPYQPKAAKPADDTRRGLLYIHCRHCGVDKGLKSKRELHTFTCRLCYGKTELPCPLIAATYTCTCCGETFRYHTNLVTGFDIHCLNCGTVNRLVYNSRTGDYRQRR